MGIRKIRPSFFWIAILTCFSLFEQQSFAQSIQTSINKKSILIGEQINYNLVFTLPSSGYTIEFNIPDSFPHFDIISKEKSDSVDGKGHYLVLQKLVFTSFDSGKWPVPSFPIKIVSSARSYTMNTDTVMINVGYAPEDSTGQLRDIKPVMEVFVIDNTWLYAIISAIIGIILLLFLYRYFKRRKKKEQPLFQSPLTPYEEAMKRLDSLKKYNLFNAPEVKEYYIELADIFKKYYSRKAQRNLMSKTTSEVLISLKEKQANETVSSIAEVLRSSDAVKFAKYLPSVMESERSVGQVKATIDMLEKSQPVKN